MGVFIDKLEAYGADTEVGLARFAGDEGLYERCFYMLIDDENFAALQEAVAAKKYDEAFSAAHALKGVVGNLELAPLYEAISVAVESLRASKLDNIEAEVAKVAEEYERIKTL